VVLQTDEGRSDRLTADQVAGRAYRSIHALLPTPRVGLAGNDLFTFVGLETVLHKLDLVPGELYRLRTLKDSCFVGKGPVLSSSAHAGQRHCCYRKPSKHGWERQDGDQL